MCSRCCGRVVGLREREYYNTSTLKLFSDLEWGWNWSVLEGVKVVWG